MLSSLLPYACSVPSARAERLARTQHRSHDSLVMSSRGRGRGWYYKAKYGGGGRGGRGREHDTNRDEPADEGYAPPADSFRHVGGGTSVQLQDTLRRIDGRGYKAYHDIQGQWRFTEFTLFVDHVQGDPYASPSKCRVLVPAAVAALPPALWSSRIRRVAVCDYLTRSFGAAVRASGGDVRAQGGGWHGEKGGEMEVDVGGQHVLERSSVLVHPDGAVEARFTVGLPAQGRSVLGEWAAAVLVENLPWYIAAGLRYDRLDGAAVQRHVECVEDTETLRESLSAAGLVAFIGDGSILPRKSGASDEPMPASEAVPFVSPPSMAVEMHVPNRGRIRGMGIKKGVTLIVGGGFHGKSTLLEALQSGVYNKIPGDGRELCATDPTAIKIRAEDGRRIASVDISPFISNLPLGRDTRAFSSSDASGSTSQAANIQEALEAGCSTLLIDEDTSATNFMVRDARMRELVAADREPITPFVARVCALAAAGVSSVLVVGGTGAFFEAAHAVIAMDCYKAEDVTAKAHAIAAKYRAAGGGEAAADSRPYPRVPDRTVVSVHPGLGQGRGPRDVRLKTRTMHVVQVDEDELDLSGVEQLVEKSQTRAVAAALLSLGRQARTAWRGAPLGEVLLKIEQEMDAHGLDALVAGDKPGNLARPRRFEIAAAINRLRSAELAIMERRNS